MLPFIHGHVEIICYFMMIKLNDWGLCPKWTVLLTFNKIRSGLTGDVRAHSISWQWAMGVWFMHLIFSIKYKIELKIDIAYEIG